MTSSSTSYLLLTITIIITFLSITTTTIARPCKTFLISSYSLSITPENPNLESDFTSTRSITVFTIRRLNPHHLIPIFVNRHGSLPSAIEKPQIEEDRSSESSLPFVNSFKDRSRDILSVVIALLFGVGCGALTAATMYLVWALVVNRHSSDDFEDVDNYENEESDAACLKKLGYVKIPDPVAPVKEAA